MDLTVAFMLATLIGQAVGMVARFVPAIPNSIVPKIVLAVNVLGNILLVANKFLEALGSTGLTVTTLASNDPVVLAGFGLKGLLVGIGAAVLAHLQLLIQRAVHEKATKVAVFGESGKI